MKVCARDQRTGSMLKSGENDSFLGMSTRSLLLHSKSPGLALKVQVFHDDSAHGFLVDATRV